MRRCSIALAAGVILALVAGAGAFAAGPGGDDAHLQAGNRKLSVAAWGAKGYRSILDAPRRWLTYSHDCFQRIMWMLADRSAGWHDPFQDWPGNDWPGPPGGYEPIPARWPDRGEGDADREARPRRPEPEPGPGDREGPQWPGDPSPSCHRAGAVVESGRWYVVGPGDTLWRIAEAHYGDGRAWRRILRANWRSVPDANCIHACQRIFIPPRWEQERPPPRGPWSEPAPGGRPIGPVRLLSPRGCTECGAGSNWQQRGWR